MTRVNPLHREALTADTVSEGDRILVWKPGDTSSNRRYVVEATPYTDDEGDMVVEVRDAHGKHILLTSEAGLTGRRDTGVWTHIAILDDDES